MLLLKNLHSVGLVIKLFGLLLILNGCEESSEMNTKALSQEVKKRKIKRITPSDILSLAKERGEQKKISIEKNWKQALDNALQSKGKEYAKKFCIVPFIPGFDTISRNVTSIKKFGISLISNSKADSLEKLILEAYSYCEKNKLPLTPNIQREGEDYILYTSPIFYDAASCKSCHTVENSKEISSNTYAGFWSVKFSKKQLIQLN